MPIAVTDDHLALADVVADFLVRHDARGAARALLDGDREGLPPFWDAVREIGWLGLHLPEAYGGSGFGLPELVVVVEQLGRALTPGPFVPTAIASATLTEATSADAGADALRSRLLPGFAAGTTTAAIGLDSAVQVSNNRAKGDAGTVLGAGMADLLMVPAGADVVIIDLRADGVDVTVPDNLDPTRRSGRVVLHGAAADVLPGAARTLLDIARVVIAAEATGIARACTDAAASYASVRRQFGRPIGTFEAVKHHCANMLVAAELATALVWEAARATAADRDVFSFAAALAAASAIPAANFDASLSIQVHGGIGFTWEHDAHLSLRRALALAAIVDDRAAAADATDLLRRGVRIPRAIELPPESEAYRTQARTVLQEVAALADDVRTRALVRSGYAVPHWPAPWGRDAGAVEQLVIEEELTGAGLSRPDYGITGWVILTLVQHASADQVARWVQAALDQDVIWCQLFSEPDAGSDAAAVTTKAARVDGGWIVNGQKVWTSGAHLAAFGLATVRTDPDAPKHNGITMMAIDMHAPGVEVRPLRMPTGASEFNEVFFTDVFVPDDDVVGTVNQGWTIARATLGNESVSIGGGGYGMTFPAEMLLPAFDAHPERLVGGAARIGRYTANTQAMEALNLRTAQRAVGGGGPGPEGAVTKLVLSENAEEAAAILAELSGPDLAFLDGPGALAGSTSLMYRALSIAGGTSEIKRNQIGERILGLPRDPLIK